MLVKVVSLATLLSFVPSSLVLTTIPPYELALAMALVFLELTDVLFAIRPLQMTKAMHFVVEPVACVLFLVAPNVGARSLDLIHLEFSFIDRSVCKGQFASAILLAFEVHPLIDSAIRPGL